MADNELLDAREAMKILGVNENDLQTLVARGDLRAFRSAGTMKFRRDDVSSLKSEKSTEPTIILSAPTRGGPKGSGILPAIGHIQAQRPGTRVGPAILSPVQENQTGDIVLDDIELMPTDDAAHTQQITINQSGMQTGVQSGVQSGILSGVQTGVQTGILQSDINLPDMQEQDFGGQTVIENGQGQPAYGEMTVAESVVVSPKATGSGRRQIQQSAPAMSRVRPAISPGVSMSTSRRTHAVYQVKTAGPVWTAFLVLNTIVFMLTASIAAVMMTRGSYDKDSGERIIPPFLSQNSSFPVYKWCYTNTSGNPEDPKPDGEYGSKTSPIRPE